MSEILDLINSLGSYNINSDETGNIRAFSGAVHSVGDILGEYGFSKNILLVADNNTLKLAEGIMESLKKYRISYLIYRDFEQATIDHVFEIERYIMGKDISVLSVGAGAIAVACTVAVSHQKKKLCVFALPFRGEHICSDDLHLEDAVMPDVVIADTHIV
ncbi:MAG: iron-containing alcohol dehydrogenase [Clostridia bacterium]|nr:iron-containing alcohol dehydrogenase [Clostridia bacterium]